jgi:GT2 family glycosyltransferase
MGLSTAVVILNYNGKNHLETYLPSVNKYTKDAKVYIADNNSTDDSIEFIKQNYPQFELIINDSNDGFAKGYNDALKNLNEDYFVLLNSDVEVTDNWLKPIIDYFNQNPQVGIAQPKIRSYREKEKFEYAGAAGGFIDSLGYPFCQGRIFQSIETDSGQYNSAKEIFWATGACMFIRSSLFKKLGGFDDRYFAHMEEIDLCWRAKNTGTEIYYIPESTVYHLGGGTMKNSNPKKTFLNFRNSLLTLHKNDTSNYTRFKIFLRLILDGLAFVKLFFDNGLNHALAIPKAHFSFYGMKKFKAEKTIKKTGHIYKGSIVLDFFLKRKKLFSQLKKGSI